MLHVLICSALTLGIVWVLTATHWGRMVSVVCVGMVFVGMVFLGAYQLKYGMIDLAPGPLQSAVNTDCALPEGLTEGSVLDKMMRRGCPGVN